MAYKLKYYADVKRGSHWERLNIYQKDFTGSAKILGTLQSLHVGLVGNESIEAPIIKSELTFTLVDAWKMADAYDSERGAYIKYGSFEEFYTSDSTMYLVELVKVANNREYPRWKGYLTPDSYSEQLIYGGSVSFIARDMIGHLADFKFEESGMCALEYIFQEMQSIASIPMDIDTYYMESLQAKVNASGGVSNALEWCINADAFKDATWYDVVEAIMDSTGSTMRWVDEDKIIVSPLRYFMDLGVMRYVQFVTSGTRAMSPAVRRIVETFNYSSGVPVFENKAKESDFTAATLTIDDWSHQVPTYIPSSTSGWAKSGNIDYYNVFTYSDGWTDLKDNPDIIMSSVRGFTKSGRKFTSYLYRTMPMASGDQRMSVSFDISNTMLRRRTTTAGNAMFVPCFSFGESKVEMTAVWAVIAVAGGKSYYMTQSGSWQTMESIIKSTASGTEMTNVNISFKTPSGCTSLSFRFYGFTMDGSSDKKNVLKADPCFGTIHNLIIEQDTNNGKFVTKTIYNDSNNVIMERSPKLGQVPLTANSNVIPNGFFEDNYGSGNPALQLFKFEEDDDYSRLSVLVARQLLCFYDKPNSELSGELIDSLANEPRFSAVWKWENRNHFLTGGKLNVLTGRVESAVLREVTNYDSLWGGVSVSPTSISIGATGGTKNVTITAANGESWNVLDLPSWVTANRTAGSGSATIVLNIAANTDYQPRTENVSIAGVQVAITQAAKAATNPEWNATNANIDFEEQEVQMVAISTNGNAVTFSTSADWLTINDTIGGITIGASENPSTSSRTANAIMSWNGGSTSVTIVQAGQPTSDPVWDATDQVIDEFAQDVETINVQNHGNSVTLTSSKTWLTITKTGNTYAVKAKANATTDVRSATIKMTWNGGSLSVTITQSGTNNSIPVWNAKDIYLDSTAQTAESIIVKDSGYSVVVSSSASWVDVNLVSGIYVVSVTANSTQAVRSALITMSWDGGSKSVTITQSGETGNVPSWNAEDVTINGDAQEVETIIANGNGETISITRNQAWLTITQSNGTYIVTASENRTGRTRTANVTMSWSGNSKSVTITQLAKRIADPVWNAESTTIDSKAQDAEIIIVVANGYEITMSSSVDWLTITQTGTAYVVAASENTSSSNRTGVVKMSWDGGSSAVTIMQYGKILNDPVWNAEDASISSIAQDVETFAVTTKGKSVSFSSDVAWLTIEDLSGLWRIKATENTGTAVRIGHVTMTWDDGSTSITIAQGGKDASNPTWDAEDKTIDGGSQRVETIAVSPNGSVVTLASNASWLTLTKQENIYIANAIANETENARSARITMSWGNGQSKYVTIIQRGQEVQRSIVYLESVSPSNASVTIDGVDVTAGHYVAVKTGSVVNVIASASGYRSYSQQMTIDEDTYLDITLEDYVDRYEVSLNLTNCSASNLYTLVDEGDLYVNTITPNEGRSIGSAVIIQMGGQTLSDVVTRNADGTISINIPSVTGNIGIMVIAS